MTFLSYTHGFSGVAEVFIRDPGLYAPLLQFIEGVMTRPSELTKVEREMIAAHVSKLNGCAFCLGAHRWTLAAMDVDWKMLDALDDGGESDLMSSRLRAMLGFAAKLTETPDEMARADVEDLVSAGWSEQGVEDAINVVALFNYVNRLVDALGIEGEETYFQHIGKALATSGYAPLIETVLKRAS
jgi:uncharacterized peroxidase-related enzyme